VKNFWVGFEKRGNSSRREMSVDEAIHSMQEDTYPEKQNIFFGTDEKKKPTKGKSDLISGSVFFDNSEDAVEASSAGAPSRYIAPQTHTLGYPG
jgi:hypothetical protein